VRSTTIRASSAQVVDPAIQVHAEIPEDANPSTVGADESAAKARLGLGHEPPKPAFGACSQTLTSAGAGLTLRPPR
jgi:hypothetical protein